MTDRDGETRVRGNPPGAAAAAVAGNVARHRRARGLTVRALADAMTREGRRMSPDAAQKIERNERRVDVDDLVALATVLGTTPADLLGVDEGDPPTTTAQLIRLEREEPELTRATLELGRLVAASGVPAAVVADYLRVWVMNHASIESAMGGVRQAASRATGDEQLGSADGEYPAAP